MCKLSQWWRQWCSPSTFCFLSISWVEGGTRREARGGGGCREQETFLVIGQQLIGPSVTIWMCVCYQGPLWPPCLPCFVRRRTSPASQPIPIWVSWPDSDKQYTNVPHHLLKMPYKDWTPPPFKRVNTFVVLLCVCSPPSLISCDYSSALRCWLCSQHMLWAALFSGLSFWI